MLPPSPAPSTKAGSCWSLAVPLVCAVPLTCLVLWPGSCAVWPQPQPGDLRWKGPAGGVQREVAEEFLLSSDPLQTELCPPLSRAGESVVPSRLCLKGTMPRTMWWAGTGLHPLIFSFNNSIIAVFINTQSTPLKTWWLSCFHRTIRTPPESTLEYFHHSETLCQFQPLPSLPVTAPGGCFPFYLFGLAYLWSYYTSWDFFLWALFNRHPCRWMACIYRILSLWPNSIPWCGQTSCYLSIHPLLGILKCFHFGAGVRDYAMNVHAQIFFLMAVLLSVYLEKEPSLVIALLGSGQVHFSHSLKSERLKEAMLWIRQLLMMTVVLLFSFFFFRRKRLLWLSYQLVTARDQLCKGPLSSHFFLYKYVLCL